MASYSRLTGASSQKSSVRKFARATLATALPGRRRRPRARSARAKVAVMAMRSRSQSAAARGTGRGSSAAAPRAWRRPILALAVAVMGFIDLFSALLSHPSDRLLALRHLVPTDVLDTSRTFTLLAGALLLVTAWGLRRGKRRAFVAALLLCAVSVPVNLLKAFDFEEATAATALMFALGVSGHAFQVRSRALVFGGFRSRVLWILLGFAVYAVGGCWLVELQYAHSHSLARALQEALYQMWGIGSPALGVPRGHRAVSWFLRSISLMGVAALVAPLLAALPTG